ncbi:MAG: hypothetical protein GWN58_17650, partial [Anaerolineae bacterium]|nr:hypothetical protein [Anaerolineae bacterium]
MAEVRAYFDPEFGKALRKAERDAREAAHDTYEPTECIHPECQNLVAPTRIKPREGHYKNYRGTGA